MSAAAERARLWRERNPERVRENMRRWRKANPERNKELVRRWAKANPEKMREKWRRQRAQNPDKYRAAVRRWVARNPEAVRENNRIQALRRRARQAQLPSERIVPLVVLELDDGICGICREDVDPMRFHVDHIVPISRGGPHTLDNVQVAHPECNQWKGAS